MNQLRDSRPDYGSNNHDEFLQAHARQKELAKKVGIALGEALMRGKSGYDFRTALPYHIGQIGGGTWVWWPEAGHKGWVPRKFEAQVIAYLEKYGVDLFLAGDICQSVKTILVEK